MLAGQTKIAAKTNIVSKIPQATSVRASRATAKTKHASITGTALHRYTASSLFPPADEDVRVIFLIFKSAKAETIVSSDVQSEEKTSTLENVGMRQILQGISAA
jgi:hypothetical protein